TTLRHVDIHGHCLRQTRQTGEVVIKWLPTTEMPAGGLMKPLPSQKREVYIKQLRLSCEMERLV
ncbi:hypothetical protein BGZ61DRAFT_370929, partial [Ilyonectria robusta]|uniref:uncharacterized protein n=1 Tax=Ilyonectria robusta TaxID=1079257 RepID=UPI001E8D9AD8